MNKAGYAVLLWVLLVSGCAQAAPKPAVDGGHFYFVQITDMHWGARDGVSLTRRAVDAINALPVKPAFVAVTGDLFADSIHNEQVVKSGMAAMKGVKVPVYFIPGNHDISKNDVVGSAEAFETLFGPVNRKAEFEGVMCLFVCTEVTDGGEHGFGDVQRTWISRNIGAGRKPVLLFMHRPPLRDMLSGSDGEVSWDDKVDSRWERLFEDRPEIKAVFAGHWHRDEMGWVGGVPVYVCPAVARFWDRKPAFRLYEYNRGRVSYWPLFPEDAGKDEKTTRSSSFPKRVKGQK